MEIRVKEGANGNDCIDKELLELIARSLEVKCDCDSKRDCDKTPCAKPTNCCNN